MIKRTGWRMVGAGRLERFSEPLGPAPAGWVTVEVEGCGVCHTDVGYLYDGVATVQPNLVLGHEIVGRVVDTGRRVIVPAVSPCGECAACRRGRPTACRRSQMPGNHHDGGFATHVQVPSRWLCEVPALPPGIEPWQLAVIADAVSTPYQAIRRAQLGKGELAVVVGVGGVGGFLIELARALGAVPIALDVSAAALESAARRGAAHCFDVRGKPAKALKIEIMAALGGRDPDGWHVFECSGSPPGQELAFGLLTRGATLSVVGFSPATVPLRLSNLMALDAEAYGNWGADPALYPEVLALVLAGQLDLAAAAERHPLSQAPDVLAMAHRRELARRAVLVPDA